MHFQPSKPHQMLEHLLSKLSISSSDAQAAAAQHRFHTHVNLKPGLASDVPRLSSEITYFLSMQGQSADELLELPAVVAPDYDDTLPLTSYFVSTSHNTYLLGDQLWGKASAASYAHVIANGAHCVEIDVWPSKDGSGPIVTHGWTLTQHIPFRDVCTTINAAVEAKDDDWPLFVSLECHVGVDGQAELVEIMKESWGERLVVSAIEGVDDGYVAPGELKGRIVMMVEYYPPDSEAEEAEDVALEEEPASERIKISGELFQLGIYARSMKPKKGWVNQAFELPHILINISESSLAALLPEGRPALVANAQRNLRRVFPRGTRIMSGNLDPLRCWRAGSHFAALNWQDFDCSMQLNEALFAGTAGWVPKPLDMLGAQSEAGKVSLSLGIIGLSALPRLKGEADFHVRIRVHLYHAAGDKEWKSKSVHCKKVPETGADAMFNESCVWTFESDELAFIRIVVTGDDEDAVAIFCARVQNMQQGYRLVRLLDTKGKDTHSTLLVNTVITSM
ncbi:hypothetical protein M0805_009041 [Coniferiporia weirii]|nr:hypothetical protein M0805_009041 [Coniferiporia weirii]